MAEAPLNTDQKKALLKQLEFYFSDSNFPKDKFLRAQAAQNEEGYVSLEIISTFARMKTLGATAASLADVVEQSDELSLNEDKTMVKRNRPLSGIDVSLNRTLYTKGWPIEDLTIEKVEKIMSAFGKVLSVRLRRTIEKQPKPSAFVEMSSDEEAKAASGKTVDCDGNEITIMLKTEYFQKKKEEQKKGKRKATDQGEPKPKRDKEFDRGVVVHIKNIGSDVTREKLREVFSPFGAVGYVEFQQGDSEGYLRMKNPAETEKAVKDLSASELDLGGNKATLAILEGEEEDTYWKRALESMKNRKKGGRGKRKRF